MFKRLLALVLTLVLAAALVGQVLAQSASLARIGIYDQNGRLVGLAEIDRDDGRLKAEVEVLRRFEGFVTLVVYDAANGVNQAFDAAVGPSGAVTVVVDGALLDLRAFMARFGDGIRVEVEFEDDFDRSDDPGRPPMRGGDDDDDDDWDDHDDWDDDRDDWDDDRDDDRDDWDDHDDWDDDRDDQDDDRDDWDDDRDDQDDDDDDGDDDRDD